MSTDNNKCHVVDRVHIAVLVRFHVYKVLGPKAEDEAYCAIADLLMDAHLAAWAAAQGCEKGKYAPFVAQEIIDAPDTTTLCYLRACKYLERQCVQWPGWEASPACAFLSEMQLAAIPLLPGWEDFREQITPEAAAAMKKDPTQGSWSRQPERACSGVYYQQWRQIRPEEEARLQAQLNYYHRQMIEGIQWNREPEIREEDL